MSIVTPNLESPIEGLRKKDLDPDPFRQFGKWFEQALGADLVLPNAMTLATSTKEGRPSARMVLLKDFDERGFVFYTNYESDKARDLEENPYAALVFYWDKLGRQVRITGRTTKVAREESEAYFGTRPRDSQIGAWASRQSEIVTGREELDELARELDVRYQGRKIPMPPHWGGYRLAPDAIEFWQNRAGRLHDRLRYSRIEEGRWTIARLQP